MTHRSREELEAGLEVVERSPTASGLLRSIVLRPRVGERTLVASARFEPGSGLVGDNWHEKPSSKTGAPNPEAEVTLMNSRAATLVAASDEPTDWAPAGDQLYADLDVSVANLPAGSRLLVGTATLEVTDDPHLGCGKFVRRFGADAMKFVNSPRGRELRLRGVNLRIVEGGEVAVGATVRRLGPADG
jgi:hypothetical protein